MYCIICLIFFHTKYFYLILLKFVIVHNFDIFFLNHFFSCLFSLLEILVHLFYFQTDGISNPVYGSYFKIVVLNVSLDHWAYFLLGSLSTMAGNVCVGTGGSFQLDELGRGSCWMCHGRPRTLERETLGETWPWKTTLNHPLPTELLLRLELHP